MKIEELFNSVPWKSPKRRIGARRAVLLALCVFVGIVSGLAAVTMRNLAHFCKTRSLSAVGDSAYAQWIIPALPAAGIVFCVVVTRIFFRKKGYEKSLWPAIREARHPGRGLSAYNMFSHIITSGVAVGMGISAGMEAPSALTGSAIGVNVARRLGLPRETCALLLSAGGAAGIASVFNAPLAGTLFACEVLLPRVNAVLLVPLLLAAASGAIISQLFRSSEDFIPAIHLYAWNMDNLLLYILLGLLCGIVSYFIIRANCAISKAARKIVNPWLSAAIGCAILYIAFLFLPALRGQGYEYVSGILRHGFGELPSGILPAPVAGRPFAAIVIVALLAFLKPLISIVSLNSGGDGGMFGPSLVTGGFLGCAFYMFMQELGVTEFPVINCVTAGMAGLISGVMHAPLTGLFLIAEMLGGYQLFVPMMIVVSLATFVSKALSGNNLYFAAAADVEKSPESMERLSGESSVELERTKIGELADRNYYTLSPRDSFRDLLQIMMQSRQVVFPVVDADERPVGMISERHIRPYILDSALYDTLIVDDFMGVAPTIISDAATVAEAAREFDRAQADFLPVVHDGRFVGMLSRAHLLEDYRWHLDNVEMF